MCARARWSPRSGEHPAQRPPRRARLRWRRPRPPGHARPPRGSRPGGPRQRKTDCRRSAAPPDATVPRGASPRLRANRDPHQGTSTSHTPHVHTTSYKMPARGSFRRRNVTWVFTCDSGLAPRASTCRAWVLPSGSDPSHPGAVPRLVRWDPPTVPFRAEHVPVDREYLRRAADRGEIVRLIRGSTLAQAGRNHGGGSSSAAGPRLPDALPDAHRRESRDRCRRTRAAAAALWCPARSAALHSRPWPRIPPSSTTTDPGGSLPAHQCQTVAEGPFEGLRVTTPERTALDLAAELPLPEGLMALDFVARRRALCHVDPMALRGEVADEVTRDAMSALLAVDRGLGRRARGGGASPWR